MTLADRLSDCSSAASVASCEVNHERSGRASARKFFPVTRSISQTSPKYA